MAATFRAAGGYLFTSQQASASPVAPSATTVGDLLLAFVTTSNNQTITPPSGWTSVAQQSSNNAQLAIYTKTAVSGDAGTAFTFTAPTTAYWTAVITAYSGASKVDTAKSVLVSSGSSAASPTVTTSTANELIVEGWFATGSGSNQALITPPATSRVASTQYTNGSASIGVADQSQSSAGTSSSVTATSNYPAYWTVATIALAGNQPPNAPTLNFPTNANQPIDRTVNNRFTWTFSDPDAGDSQSAFDLRYCVQNGSYPSTPQYSGTTPNNYLDIPGGTFAAGSYQWQVRTYDSQGVVGPWSSAAFFTASTPPTGPTITYPTSGGTVNASDHIDWSYTTQQSYQVQRVADNAGAIDTTTVYYDTGEVQDPNNTIRTQALTFPTNNRYEWLRLRIKQGNQWSAWVQIRVQVSYSPPPTPTFTVTVGQPNAAAMRVAVTNPAPSGSAPAATSNVIEASRDGGATVEWSRGAVQTVNPNATVPFFTPLSGAVYSFRVTAKADNLTTSNTGWITP